MDTAINTKSRKVRGSYWDNTLWQARRAREQWIHGELPVDKFVSTTTKTITKKSGICSKILKKILSLIKR